MLSLARKVGESVSLTVALEGGYGIEIALMVTEIRRGNIKLGFEAPPEVAIVRSELLTERTDALVKLLAAYDRRCAG